MKSKVFSGIRPSGDLHLGHYFGVIKNLVELQKEVDQMIFGIVDYHAITTPYEPKELAERVLETACIYLAAGIDLNKSLLMRQSHVPQHTELAWLFSTITPVGWLERLPTYKEKLEQVEHFGSERAKSYQNNVGLLTYPVLMAADILVYKSNLVPVGEDQLKHLDIANEIGKKFNHLFGETFEPVKPYVKEGARVLSLQDPTKKMSKTGDDPIGLLDSADEIRSKIRKATTDSGKEIKYDPANKPAISNLIEIYHLLSGEQIGEIEVMYQDKTYVEFKTELAEVVVNFLKPFQDKYQEFKSNPDKVLAILEKSEEQARMIASSNIKEIKEKMGIL